mmetsp:Transcript_27972/g.32175  ORF Transcript_27972/g.32175 Transcript_27972/m.32175 type:complete len:91 (+) Transcript_27972:381-653(+)
MLRAEAAAAAAAAVSSYDHFFLFFFVNTSYCSSIYGKQTNNYKNSNLEVFFFDIVYYLIRHNRFHFIYMVSSSLSLSSCTIQEIVILKML